MARDDSGGLAKISGDFQSLGSSNEKILGDLQRFRGTFKAYELVVLKDLPRNHARGMVKAREYEISRGQSEIIVMNSLDLIQCIGEKNCKLSTIDRRTLT